jgi:hypothetical protein
MVDDDTYVNMNLLDEYLEADPKIRPQEPHVSAGCRIRIARGENSVTIFPWGGFGVVFSQQTLVRLQKPIHCTSISESSTRFENLTMPDTFEEQVCAAISNNLIKEKPLFRDGMSILDLMEAFTIAQPFEKYRDWTTGFCLHSDHFLGYFIEYYFLSQHGLQTIQNSEYVSAPQVTDTTGNCLNTEDTCNATSSIVCHNQSPNDMDQLVANTMNRFIVASNGID